MALARTSSALVFALAAVASASPHVVVKSGPVALVVVEPEEPGEPRIARVLVDRKTVMERAVRSVRGARAHDLDGDGNAELIVDWERPDAGPEVVGLAVAGGAARALFAVVARGFDLADADGDGTVDLIAFESRGRTIGRAPVPYRWSGSALEPLAERAAAYHAGVERALAARIAAEPPPERKEDPSFEAERLVDMLDLGLLHEVRGKRADAWRTYGAVLARAGVPTRLTRDEAAARAARVDVAREARLAMARLAGLRVVGETASR
jgi:hypothetical protein